MVDLCRRCQHLLDSGYACRPHVHLTPLGGQGKSRLFSCCRCHSVFEFRSEMVWLLGYLKPVEKRVAYPAFDQ